MGEALGQDSGLTRARARDHQHGAVTVLDRFLLALVRRELAET
jgi:hypothetical protein